MTLALELGDMQGYARARVEMGARIEGLHYRTAWDEHHERKRGKAKRKTRKAKTKRKRKS